MYTWFYIFNYDEFIDLGLVSRTYDLVLEGIGATEILVTKGAAPGITYDGVFLPLELNDENPFAFEGYAIYRDENDNIWLGIEIED